MVTGLAWTEVGGEILKIESAIMPGKGKMQITGKLGDVMQESVKAAKSYIRSKKYEFLVALDPNQQVMKKMSVKLLPTTILVDKDGSVLFRHQGYSPGDEQIILKHITDKFDEDEIKYEQIEIEKS